MLPSINHIYFQAIIRPQNNGKFSLAVEDQWLLRIKYQQNLSKFEKNIFVLQA